MEETFKNAPDDIGLVHRKTWGIIEIGLYPVVYGWRIRAGKIGSGFVHLDYCAGDNLAGVAIIHALVLSILTRKSNELETFYSGLSERVIVEHMFKGFPVQQAKPMNNDIKCLASLFDLAGQRVIITEDAIPDLDKLRQQYYEKYITNTPDGII